MRAESNFPFSIVIATLVSMMVGCGGGGSGGSTNNGGSTSDSSPTVDAGADLTVASGSLVTLTATIIDDGTNTVSWSQTAGTDVVLSSTSTADTEFTAPSVADIDDLFFDVTVDDGVNAAVTDTVSVRVVESPQLSNAYLWFGQNVTVALDGAEVVLEATGRPDHTSCYWDPGNASGLYVPCDPTITDTAQMSPGFIENYNNLFTLRVSGYPRRADASSATGLGPVGIAVSGAPIFNDQEGPNVALELGVISGFDRNGAHTGPQTYHYHLEPRAITNNDSSLVGVMADGFFLYGRICYSTSDYPTDLDESGGHTSITQHTGAQPGDEEYHYHIKDEFYLGAYYLLFPEDFQGTPSNIGG